MNNTSHENHTPEIRCKTAESPVTQRHATDGPTPGELRGVVVLGLPVADHDPGCGRVTRTGGG